MPTICLNMIVKNEAPVIRRCLASVRPWIDAWVIVDTGSTDGTQALIREALAGIPGELHERPWVDFGSNRSEAITLAVENLPTGVVASGSIPADASTGRLTIAVAEGIAAQNLGSLSLQGSSGTKKQTTSLALSILAPLPASSLPTGSTVASGSDQTGGSGLQNHAVALEPVSITTAKNPQETVELRHGFLPTPQPSLP